MLIDIVAYRLQQMGLSKPYSAIDKAWIVAQPWVLCYHLGGIEREYAVVACDEVIERIGLVKRSIA